MVWHIANWVTHGEWDSRQRGCVFSRLWLASRREPVTVELTGNSLRDLAGCLLVFRRRNGAKPPRAAPSRVALVPFQRGSVGDATASRRVWEPSGGEEEWDRTFDLDVNPPEEFANCLSLEWYNEIGDQLLLESTEFEMQISEHAWTLTVEEDHRQRAANARLYQAYLRRCSGELPAASEDGTETG
jgi:hypothetical protein